jgi:hypothetical protein
MAGKGEQPEDTCCLSFANNALEYRGFARTALLAAVTKWTPLVASLRPMQGRTTGNGLIAPEGPPVE